MLSVQPRTPGETLPPQAAERLQLVARESLRLFDPLWSLEDAYRWVVTADREQDQTDQTRFPTPITTRWHPP